MSDVMPGSDGSCRGRQEDSPHLRRLVRVISCLNELTMRDRCVTVDGLTESLGVSRRTVFRDIALLRRAGVEILFDPEGGRYSLASGNRSDSANWPLSREESILLLASIPPRTGVDGGAIRSSLRAAVAKLVKNIAREFDDTPAGILGEVQRRRATQPHPQSGLPRQYEARGML